MYYGKKKTLKRVNSLLSVIYLLTCFPVYFASLVSILVKENVKSKSYLISSAVTLSVKIHIFGLKLKKKKKR